MSAVQVARQVEQDPAVVSCLAVRLSLLVVASNRRVSSKDTSIDGALIGLACDIDGWAVLETDKPYEPTHCPLLIFTVLPVILERVE